jgi:hypothetical protein
MKEDYDPNFSGVLALIDVSDSSATFLKTIVSNGDWTRQYHLIKK